MEILTPTEACLESSSDLTIATTEDIDIEHVHVFARRPIRSEVLVRCVRSTSARLENTMLTIRDGRCATVPPVLSLGCSVVSGIRHLDGTSTCAAGRRQTRPETRPERSVRPIMQTSIASEYPRVRRRVLDRVMSLRRFTNAERSGRLGARRGRAGAGGVDPIVINL
jgi:hypothetical protein